jgi:hypothetical protein
MLHRIGGFPERPSQRITVPSECVNWQAQQSYVTAPLCRGENTTTERRGYRCVAALEFLRQANVNETASRVVDIAGISGRVTDESPERFQWVCASVISRRFTGWFRSCNLADEPISYG